MSQGPQPAHAVHEATGPLSTSREALLAGVLLLAMFVGIFPQYALGVLAPLLTSEAGISEWQLGVVASCLHISAAVIARVTGRRLDVMSGRLALFLLFCTATGSLLVLAASRSLVWVVVSVAFGGIAIGANNPVTNRLVADHVRAGRRGRLISVKQVGVKLSHVTSGVLLPALALTLGWRLGLSLFALTILAIATLALLGVPAGRPAPPPASTSEGDGDVGPRVRWLRHYALLMATGMAAITTYLPLYAVQVVGMSLTEAGLVVTVLGLTGVVLRLVWGHLADRGMPPAGLLMVLGAAAGVSLVGVSGAAWLGPWLLWASAVLAGVSLGSWNVLAHITVVNEISAVSAARATGLVQASFLVGFAAGSPLFGSLIELGGFVAAWCVTGALCTAASLVALVERRRRVSHRSDGDAVRAREPGGDSPPGRAE